MTIIKKDNDSRIQIINKLQEYKIDYFYYFSYLENLESILQYGILSKNEVKNRHIKYKSFAMEDVQEKRDHISICLSSKISVNLHELIPLYLTPKTPTLYKVRNLRNEIFFAIIKSEIIIDDESEFGFTDGNATSPKTIFFNDLNDLSKISWNIIHANYWNEFGEIGRLKRCAEFLIYPNISIKHIEKIIVINQAVKKYVEDMVNNLNIKIKVECQASYFF